MLLRKPQDIYQDAENFLRRDLDNSFSFDVLAFQAIEIARKELFDVIYEKSSEISDNVTPFEFMRNMEAELSFDTGNYDKVEVYAVVLVYATVTPYGTEGISKKGDLLIVRAESESEALGKAILESESKDKERRFSPIIFRQVKKVE